MRDKMSGIDSSCLSTASTYPERAAMKRSPLPRWLATRFPDALG